MTTKTLQFMCVVTASTLVVLLHLWAGGWGLVRPDAKQYAAIADRWVTTGQYQGVLTRGSEIATLEESVPDRPWPASYARPGFPILLAGAFLALGASDVSYHIVNVLCFCLLGWGIFLLSDHVGGSRVGWLGLGLLFVTGSLIWEGLYSGLEMPYMALSVLCAVVLVKAATWIGAAAAGGILSYVVFLRPTALAFLPLVLLLRKGRQPRRVLAGSFLGGVLVLMVAGYLYETRISPPPFNTASQFNHLAFNLLSDTALQPGASIDTTYSRTDWAAVRKHRGNILAKVARGLANTPLKLAEVFPPWLLALAVWGLARGANRNALNSLAGAAAASGLLVVVGLNLTTAGTLPRHFFVPLLLLVPLAAVGLANLLDGLQAQRSWLTCAAGIVMLLSLVGYGALFNMVEKIRIPNRRDRAHVAEFVKPLTSPNDIIGTSYSVAADVAWYAQRRTVVLPTDPQQCQRVVDDLLPGRTLVIGERDAPDVFARTKEIFPEYQVAGRLIVETSQWASPYYVLRPMTIGQRITMPNHPVTQRGKTQ